MLRNSCRTERNGCPRPLQVLQCLSPISGECALSTLLPVTCIHRPYLGIIHGQAGLHTGMQMCFIGLCRLPRQAPVFSVHEPCVSACT